MAYTHRQQRDILIDAGLTDEERLRFALRIARMYVWERDLNSQKVTRFGDPTAVIGVGMDSIDDFLARVHAQDRSRVRDAIELTISRCEPFDLEFRILRPDGSTIWVRDIGRRITVNGRDRFLGVCMDVTSELEARLAIAKLGLQDSLTGLPNRTLVHQKLAEAVANLQALGREFTVLCIDLDHFKPVNDEYGHHAGDELLIQISAVLRAACKPGDIVGRLGGDEFIVIQSSGDLTAATRIAQTLQERAQKPFSLEGREVTIGFSIGAAVAPRDGRTADDVLRAADTALYKVKENGRGGMCFYESWMDGAARQRQNYRQYLRDGLAAGTLSPRYQPMFELHDGSMETVEISLPIELPQSEHAQAQAMLGAEDGDLMRRLGEWMLREAADTLVNWPSIRVSMSVAAAQLRQPTFVPNLISIIGDKTLPPRRLELLVSEDTFHGDCSKVLASLRQLQTLGVSITLSDFGAGDLSLKPLFAFTFDGVKIDGALVGKHGQDPSAEAAIKALLGVAHGMNIRTTASNVDTIAALRLLSEEGCAAAQGSIFAAGTTASEIAQHLLPSAQAARCAMLNDAVRR